MASSHIVTASSSTCDKGSQQYPYPSHVNASSFVSMKLSGTTNYHRWQEQMMCLVESHDMLSFIDGTFENPKQNNDSKGEAEETTMEAKYREWKRSDSLIKGWIFGSLSEDVMDTVVGLHTANDVWMKLKTSYGTPTTPSNEGSQQYKYPSHVNAPSFLSIKLSGMINYRRWQEQMMCFLESHDMLGFIDGTLGNPNQINDSKKKADKTAMKVKYSEWKKSDTLVKGWIFGSLSEEVMDTVIGLQTANKVWKKLKTTYDAPAAPPTIDWREYRPLYGATLDGDWEKAREIFNKDRYALTAKMNDHEDSPLHVAVSTCENIKFVENLLKEINPESLPPMVNIYKLTALHRAAQFGNTKAAEMLVEKNPYLLFTTDKHGYLPIHRAVFGSHLKTYQYLLNVTKQHIMLSEHHGYESPFKHNFSAVLLDNLIRAGFLDDAYELIKEYPDMARTKRGKCIPLKSIAGKLDSYYSGTPYNFYQRFVYSYVLKDDGLDNADEIQDIENQDTDNANSFAGCSRSHFKNVIRMIYVKFWKVTLPYVPQIKHLREDKAKHNTSLMLLKCICEEVGKMNRVSAFREHYLEAITSALEKDIPMAIEEITKFFPHFISTMHNDYHLNQLAIVNRCEKVYNFLVYQVAVPDKQFHNLWLDKDENNLLHLAGKLAPIDKLNLVSGAALQMQRELQWFEEVKKFVLHRHTERKNKNQETPIMVFRREHNELRKEGEAWMKKTADSYTITAALIITIVFAAAITVPGGNDGNTGKAIFEKKSGFIIFAVSDAISLFASTTSLLLCLSILTARYRDEDFLYSLPQRLILGLAMLFLSVTSMMVAFSATLYIMFGQEKAWILILIAALTCLPIASFVTLQLPLLVDLISSTYGQGIFGKRSDRMIK